MDVKKETEKEANKLRSRRLRKEAKENKKRAERMEWFIINVYPLVHAHFEQWDKQNKLCGAPPQVTRPTDLTPPGGTSLTGINPFAEQPVFDMELLLYMVKVGDPHVIMDLNDPAFEELVARVP